MEKIEIRTNFGYKANTVAQEERICSFLKDSTFFHDAFKTTSLYDVYLLQATSFCDIPYFERSVPYLEQFYGIQSTNGIVFNETQTTVLS